MYAKYAKYTKYAKQTKYTKYAKLSFSKANKESLRNSGCLIAQLEFDCFAKYVENITDLVSPENCLAVYFQGYLENKISGKIKDTTIKSLENRLEKYPYWKERFDQYNLSVDHLKKGIFNVDNIMQF